MNKLWTGTRIALCVGLGMLLGGTAFARGSKIQVQWLGQSATKITTPSGKVIVIDPWLINNPKTPMEYKKLEALGTTSTKVMVMNPGDKVEF